jgi:hypothetical protein
MCLNPEFDKSYHVTRIFLSAVRCSSVEPHSAYAAAASQLHPAQARMLRSARGLTALLSICIVLPVLMPRTANGLALTSPLNEGFSSFWCQGAEGLIGNLAAVKRSCHFRNVCLVERPALAIAGSPPLSNPHTWYCVRASVFLLMRTSWLLLSSPRSLAPFARMLHLQVVIGRPIKMSPLASFNAAGVAMLV